MNAISLPAKERILPLENNGNPPFHNADDFKLLGPFLCGALVASSATETQGETGCLLAACQQNNSCSCHKQKEAANR